MISFKELQESDMELVLKWRISAHVSDSMFTEVEEDLAMQIKWFNKMVRDDSVRYWLVYFNQNPVGVVNLAEIDHDNKRCTAGYYIGDLSFKGLGAMIPPFLYNYVFLELGFNKIYGLVLSSNLAILRIHKLHGFRIVGILESHVQKGKDLQDVVVIELLAEKWLKSKKFSRDIGIFPDRRKTKGTDS